MINKDYKWMSIKGLSLEPIELDNGGDGFPTYGTSTRGPSLANIEPTSFIHS